MRTSELTGAALDWAVRECLDRDQLFEYGLLADVTPSWKPSINWAQGGPIIEREGLRLEFHGDTWEAMMWWDDEATAGEVQATGPTPLIAAMRCYVSSKLGDKVDVPDELTGVNQ